MKRRVGLLLVAVLGVTAVGSVRGTAHAAGDPPADKLLVGTAGFPATERTTRVVWDADRFSPPLIKIYSANIDGSDRQVLYQRKRGFVLDLTLDRAGERVAFAPYNGRRRKASLIVADVADGQHLNLLAKTRRFESVGGIGWSPTGRRLVFEGGIVEPTGYHHYLWTIKPDGTALRRIASRIVNQNRGPVVSNNLAWTSRGIFFLDVRGLVLQTERRQRVLVPNAWAQWISGNGRWLFLERIGAESSLWRMHPNGQNLQRIIRRTRPHSTMGYLTNTVPDYSGEHLLTVAEGASGDQPLRIFVHPSTRAPRAHDATLDFTGHGYVITWN